MPQLTSKGTGPAVSQSILDIPAQFPELPDEIRTRFPTAGTWQESINLWWRKSVAGLTDFSNAVNDRTGLAGILKVNGETGAIYIRNVRGPGAYNNPDTPFYVDQSGFFSLKNKLTWDPTTNTLTITGTINADSGTIGGFEIGADYIRDTGDMMGLSSEVTGGDDVRFWAGDTFANRATAPFRVYESGAVVATSATISGSITATSGTIGGFDIGSDYIRDAGDSMGMASAVTGGDDVRFWAGDTFANRASAAFRVYESGTLVASNATITGTITSSSGTIGGFTLGATSLSAGSGSTYILISNTAGTGVRLGDQSVGQSLLLQRSTGGSTGLYLFESGTDTRVVAQVDASGNGRISVYDTSNNTFFDANSSGTITFGNHTTLGGETVTGYITILDASGATRKLAVVS